MTNSIKILAAAVLFSSAAFSGAMARDVGLNPGDFYQGADPHGNTARAGEVILPDVDRTPTGSITNDVAPNSFETQDAPYYDGAERPIPNSNDY